MRDVAWRLSQMATSPTAQRQRSVFFWLGHTILQDRVEPLPIRTNEAGKLLDEMAVHQATVAGLEWTQTSGCSVS